MLGDVRDEAYRLEAIMIAHPDPSVLPPISDHIWRQKYRFTGEDGHGERTLAETWRRVARAAASVERNGAVANHWAGQFETALSDLTMLPAGRIIAGAGTGRDVTLFNCFVMGRIEDDLSAIFDQVKEAALTLQRGGGIGHDFSTLRPRGAPVRSMGADASGPASFMDVWDAMCRTIMSAGARRGAMMATLRCDHPDIEAFIDAKADPARLRNFNLSVLVTDAFLAAVRADGPFDLVFGGKVYRTVRARDVWDRLMRATYAYAEPGVIFIDRINAENNLAYCETIQATNPCVTSDTWVQTKAGPRQVCDLIGRQVEVMIDGQSFATEPAGFFQTGRKPIVRLETEDGYSVRLTADHRVRVVTRATRWTLESEWRAAGLLVPGDRVVLHDHGAIAHWEGPLTEDQGYLVGLLVGDGTLKIDKAVLSVWWPAAMANGSVGGPSRGVRAVMAAAAKAAMSLPHRSDFGGWSEVGGRNEMRLSLGALKQLALQLGMTAGNKLITPEIERASSDFYRGFLRGFFDADGSVQGDQSKGLSIRLAQSDIGRLQAVQRMLLRLGIVSTLYRERRQQGLKLLPNGRGSKAEYSVQAQHELIISGANLARYRDMVGFADLDKREKLDSALLNYKRALNRERFTARVKGVVTDGVADVFDVQVPGANCFDANGIHVHNCGEQPLPAYGACLLGSINLARLVRDPFGASARLDEGLLENRVGLLVRLLDNVIELSEYPLPQQRGEALAKRRLGIGVTGLADALVMLGERYGGAAAVALTDRWMGKVQHAAYAASARLAAERGAFPLFDREAMLARPGLMRLSPELRDAIARDGLRNGCLTSVAPTGTISLLAGNVSSGIEPIFDLRYRRRVLGPDGTPHELEVEDYAHRLFRAAHGERAPLPAAFVTAGELSPAAHLAMQAAAQRHVDSSISKTINCPADMPFEAFRDVYLEADRLGLKGCTTFRPNAITGSVLTAGTDGATLSRRDTAAAMPPLASDAAAPGFAEDFAPGSAARPPSFTPSATATFAPRSVMGAPEPCPRCGDTAPIRSEGCWVCPRCGQQRCG